MVGVGIIPSLISGVGMIFLPESPCWLIKRGRVADTIVVLQQTLKTNEEVETGLTALREAARIPSTMGDENFIHAVPQDIHVLAIWQELRRPLIRPQLKKILISVFTLHALQQLLGIDVMTTKSLLRFPHEDPVFEPMDYLLEQLLPLCGRLLPIFVPLFISDVIGQRLLLRYSLVAVGCSMAFNSGSSTMLNAEVIPGTMKVINKFSVAAYFGSFSIGLGPLTMVHTSEALPFKVRAQVMGIALMANRLVGFSFTYLKPTLDRVMTDLLSWIIGVMALFGLWVCDKYVIETSGASLEDLS